MCELLLNLKENPCGSRANQCSLVPIGACGSFSSSLPKRERRNEPVNQHFDPLISERTTAEILGISPDTLRRLGRRGERPARRKISPRRIGYKVSEVEAYRDGKLRQAMSSERSAPRQKPKRRTQS